jgi:U3 small nucleolar RNA-associated protein 19
MLQDHYNPNVARFCKILSEQFTKPSFNLEDFLDHSYTTMMEEDWKKEIRKPVAIEYELTQLLSGPVKAVEGETRNRFLAFAV